MARIDSEGTTQHGSLYARSLSTAARCPATAFIVREGERWPIPDDEGDYRRVASREVEFIRNGMPTGVSLFVWLPDRREKWVERRAERGRQIRAALGR